MDKVTEKISAQGIDGDNTILKQNKLIPKYILQPDRPHAIQQAFSTGAALVIETGDGFSKYHPDNLGYHEEANIYT